MKTTETNNIVVFTSECHSVSDGYDYIKLWVGNNKKAKVFRETETDSVLDVCADYVDAYSIKHPNTKIDWQFKPDVFE